MKIMQLVNHTIGVMKGQEPESPGSPNLVPTWTLVLQDQNSGDQIQVAFREPVRDSLIQQLTGGIVVANGDLSKIVPDGHL